MGVDRIWRAWRGRRTAWRLFHDGSAMECQIWDAGTQGVEIRYLYCGELYHSFRHHTRAAAEEEAQRKRRELVERGWRERSIRSDVEQTS